jgi:hypothetical protein
MKEGKSNKGMDKERVLLVSVFETLFIWINLTLDASLTALSE